MIPVSCFKGKNVALFGLGGSGLATARALLAGGARVSAWDDGEAGRAKALAAGIAVVDLRGVGFAGFDALVLSPGVPLTHPAPHWAAAKASAAGIEIIGDIELFCRERAAIAPGSAFVAITGTNGKSTTTALLAHILASAGRDVAMGGNIGVAVLDLAPPAAGRIHVIECSSFQIDLAPSLRPSIGILTNLTPDHLDRHGTMQNYAAIKAQLVRGAGVAFVSVDDGFCARIAQANAKGTTWPLAEGGIKQMEWTTLPGGTWPVSITQPLQRGVFVENGQIRAGVGTGMTVALGSPANAANLRGQHNLQNAAFAAAAAWQFGLSPAEIQRGLESFPGLPHRMENVARLGKVLFVNDSKATNADSTEKAMLSFNDMFLILGGKPKEGGIEFLRPLFHKIRKAYLIGAAAAEFTATLGDVPHEICGTLDKAVVAAARDAAASDASEPVVLLSPACASYDQFANFEARGDHFRTLVKALVAAGEATR